jgi:hypothetical protein
MDCGCQQRLAAIAGRRGTTSSDEHLRQDEEAQTMRHIVWAVRYVFIIFLHSFTCFTYIYIFMLR